MSNTPIQKLASKGGTARAKKLTAEERSAIARNAVQERWRRDGRLKEVAAATHEGTLKLGGEEIPCANLADGTRILSRAQVIKAIGRKGKAKGGRRYDEGFKTPVFLTAQNLKPFIPNDLTEDSNPIIYYNSAGTRSIGYRAELLPKICGVFIDAADAGALRSNQLHIAQKCKILMRGFATVGIIALVDEATGYQRDRKRDELADILEAFVAKEIQKYLKTFDLEFYELICELRREPLERAQKRPKYFAGLTNNLIYDRLAPGVRQELQRREPMDEHGRRKKKLFQHLTPDHGHPKLKAHLEGVTTGMKFAKFQGLDWQGFLKLLDKTHPKFKPMPLFEQTKADDQNLAVD